MNQSGRRIFLCTLLTGMAAATASGCGATCKRMAEDRQAFLERQVPSSGEPHLEVTVPFALTEKLISQQLDKIEPVALAVPGLGKLGSYFGELRLRPTFVRLLPARSGRLGFELEFEVQSHGSSAFSLTVQTEVKPDIELSQGLVNIGFSPEAFESVRPRIDSGSAKKLGGIIYGRIPGLARGLVSRDAVDKAAAGAVDLLLRQFYTISKDTLLRRISRMSQLSIALPDVPIAQLSLRTVGQEDKALQLLVTSKLPVSAGLSPMTESPSRRLVTLRLTASATAELANWAMNENLLPSRFDKKGRPQKDGELVAGLEWVAGQRPMKIHLWQLEGSCKRIDLGAEARVAVNNGKVQIEATGAVIEGSQAAALTELGIFFVSLWKDAIDKTLSTKAELRFEVAGREVVTEIENASLEKNVLSLGVSVRAAQ